MPRILRDPDFLLALFTLCISTIVAAYAYASINEIEQPSQALIKSVQSGPAEFKILSGATCPGDIKTTLVHDAAWGIKSTGHLRAAYGKQLTDVHFDFSGLFNPLGQLNSAHLEISTDLYKVTAALSNPHPISVEISTSGEGPAFHETFSIPGPITIQKNRDDTYRIDYSYLAMANNPSVKAAEGFMSRELNLSIVQADKAPADCDHDGAARIDLLPLLVKTGPLLQPMLSLSADQFFNGNRQR